MLRKLVALCLFALAPLSSAQTWPDRPIRFLMSAPAGSSIDALGRAIADKLRERLGQPVVVEHKPAAGGTVGRSPSRRSCRSCPTTSRRTSRR